MTAIRSHEGDSPARLSGVLLFTIVAPCLAVVLGLAAFGATALVTGRSLLWPPRDATLSEAIVLRDQAEMARLITNGADPNARYDVVDVIRPRQRDQLTPLEAAVVTRERYLVELVVGYGGVIDAGNAPTLRCLARAIDADEIVAYLAGIGQAVDACDRIALPYR